MPFGFSAVESEARPVHMRCIEDRRNNPVANRATRFRLLQQNILDYTYPFVPGFGPSAINTSMSLEAVLDRAIENAEQEGQLFFGTDFSVSANAKAKVAGDIFEVVESAIHWNTAARWNRYMVDGMWPPSPRYPRPPAAVRQVNRQVAALNLPRGFDWVRLLVPEAKQEIGSLRHELAQFDLLLPTSTPDMVIVALPEEHRADPAYQTDVPNLSRQSQTILNSAYEMFLDRVEPGEFILAMALKRSLRSDRLYQPLYEANIMQLLLEDRLGAPQVDFEVHTLGSAGTDAQETYRAASLARVATQHASPHRAVRELYEPVNADEVVRRFLEFLNHRMALVP